MYTKDNSIYEEEELPEIIYGFVDFPDTSKTLIRKRDAGTGLYDQINKFEQKLYISNNAEWIVFISLKGIMFKHRDDDWKIVNRFQGNFQFNFEVGFEYLNHQIEKIKIILAMRVRMSKYTEKLEFQYITLDIKEGSPPTKRLSNLLHLVKVPFEFIEKAEIKSTNPILLKMLDTKCVVWINYSDSSLEHSKLFLLHKVEEEIIMSMPLLPNINNVSSTCRNACIQNIQSVDNTFIKNDSDDNLELDGYLKPLFHSKMFLITLSNGEFLLYSEFDGRFIDVRMTELYSQSRILNRELFKVSDLYIIWNRNQLRTSKTLTKPKENVKENIIDLQHLMFLLSQMDMNMNFIVIK